MPVGSEYRCSTWIGLDGQRRYFDSTLPQIGTGQFLNPPLGVPAYSAWWQWWMRDNPATYMPAPIISVPVAPGQRMMASLKVLNEIRVRFEIKNVDTGAYSVFEVDSPPDPTTGLHPHVSGATAEWITERPSDGFGDPYELPNYNLVDFDGCIAVSAVLPPGGVPGPGWQQPLSPSRPINMYRVARNPSRTILISRAERLDPDEVGTNYVS
jgi:hypothetical protein